MCWLAVGASHSNGLSHLQGRQAHSLTLCVPLPSFPASQTAVAMGGTQKKKKIQEPHSNRLEKREEKRDALLLSQSPHLYYLSANQKHK